MLNLYKYYFKKRLIPLGILVGILTVIMAVFVLTGKFVHHSAYSGNTTYSTPFVVVTVLTCILATVVPFVEFAFKTNKKSIDLFYAFPIKRYRLFLTKYLVGLTEIIIPLTFSYIVMVLLMLTKENGINPIYYLYFFLIIIACSIMIYTITAFSFTRGNTIWDGIITTGFIMCVGAGFLALVSRIANNFDSSMFFGYSQISVLTSLISNEAVGTHYYYLDNHIVEFILCNVLTVLATISAFIGFIILNNKEKPENATELTESLFSYKVMLPIYIVCFMGVFSLVYISIIFAVAGFIGYIIYNRGFKLKLYMIIPMISSMAVGLILSIVLTACGL